MTTWSVGQATQFADLAGFTGSSVNIIVAIAQAESSLNDQAHNVNTNGTVDRGILQINGYYHSEVSDACAYDPQCAFKAAYTISKQGTNFSPWSTYQSGAYLKYTNVTPYVPVKQPVTPFAGTPWYEMALGEHYGDGYAGTTEHGTDFETPADTPITFLAAGTITDISSPGWGHQVTWKLDKPWNNIPYAYQIHLDAVNPTLKVGSHVNAGDLMGWSGGAVNASQIGNATNPTGQHFYDSISYSSGPHTEFGFSYGPIFASGTGWVDTTAHPELNPIQFINEVRSGQIPEPQGYTSPTGGGSTNNPGGSTININTQPTAPSAWASVPVALTGANDAFLSLSDNIHANLQHAPGFYGIALGIDEASNFVGIYNAFSGDNNPSDWASNAVMSVLGTIGGNMLPLFTRGIVVFIGAAIVISAVMQAAKPFYSSESVATIAKTAAGAML